MKIGQIGELGRLQLLAGECPFCEGLADFEESFVDADNREGGIVVCNSCELAVYWIDDPFEYDIKEGANIRKVTL